MAEKSCEKGPGGLKHLCLRVRYLVLVGACDGATELGVSTDGSHELHAMAQSQDMNCKLGVI